MKLNATRNPIKEVRKEIYDELDKAKKALNSTIGSDLFNGALEDVRFFEKELLKLESFYYEDKTFKEGDDLTIAEAIRNFKAAKQKATEDGVPLFESFITYTAQLTWEEDKKQLDEEFKTAQLNLEQGVITQEQFDDVKTKRDQSKADVKHSQNQTCISSFRKRTFKSTQ